MSEPQGQVTERTFYPALIDVIRERGGSGVSEIHFVSQPDIIFTLLDRKWLLSVKIGDDVGTVKDAFIQYQRHKDESQLDSGLILFMPTSVRNTRVSESAIVYAVNNTQVSCLVDTPLVKQEYRGITFPQILLQLMEEIGVKIQRHQEQTYPMSLVIKLLQQHVTELMGTVSMADPLMLRVITDRNLLSGIGHLTEKDTEAAGHFLAAYLILSQILFLRLFSSAQPDKVPEVNMRPINHGLMRQAFARILKINYRPIFEIDVLDSISEKYLCDTFDLIWGLQVEKVRYELPGRIFHELMPAQIRKMLAAFYTRPLAADILSGLSIRHSDETVFDPACGSGTILTAAYKRKLNLFMTERKVGNPHKRFCENEIFGADIMPFAVHLTSANLAAMDPGTTLGRTQIIQGDSLQLSSGTSYRNGVQIHMFQTAKQGETAEGERYHIELGQTDVILMNPPFTKVERGIQKFVNMERFQNIIGGEVGLWGHFIALADEFLSDGGIFGAVLPINVLRGRESAKIREFIFTNWTPLYILKPTFNYGFSEWSEYRDILLIARKIPASSKDRVKFCLIKQDLTSLTREDVSHIVNQIGGLHQIRSEKLDIESFSVSELRKRFVNLMWFCGVTDFRSRDIMVSFLTRFSGILKKFPDNYLREGYRPVPKGVSSFLFLTRNLEPSRTEEAFLSFDGESNDEIEAISHLKVSYKLEKNAFTPTLRTGVGINTMSIQKKWDYIANQPYHGLDSVITASGFTPPDNFDQQRFWENIRRELGAIGTKLVVVHRINPYSPYTYLTAFVSNDIISPSNMLNVVQERDLAKAKAVGVLFNSALFFANFFLLKEETTGRYINLRFYDLDQIPLYPSAKLIPALATVFDEFAEKPFPSIREQMDIYFDQRYEDFWTKRKGGQASLFSVLNQGVTPSRVRIDFDLAVCKALGVDITEHELTQLYSIIVNEMMITRGLQRD